MSTPQIIRSESQFNALEEGTLVVIESGDIVVTSSWPWHNDDAPAVVIEGSAGPYRAAFTEMAKAKKREEQV